MWLKRTSREPMTKTWRRSRNLEVSLVRWLTYRVGMDEIARKLNVDLKMGLKDQEAADDRASDFGSNKRDLMKPKPCYQFLKEQLSDIMLIILIVAAVFSLILNFATASPEEYSTGKLVSTPPGTISRRKDPRGPCQADSELQLPYPLKNKINYNLYSLDRRNCHFNRSRCCLRSRFYC